MLLGGFFKGHQRLHNAFLHVLLQQLLQLITVTFILIGVADEGLPLLAPTSATATRGRGAARSRRGTTWRLQYNISSFNLPQPQPEDFFSKDIRQPVEMVTNTKRRMSFCIVEGMILLFEIGALLYLLFLG